MNAPLWNVAERKQWFGGGYDDAGIHSIVSDPRAHGRMAVSISCGGVWQTDDNGKTWTVGGDGLIATYMPPERQRDSADPGSTPRVGVRRAPDVMWMQHHCGMYRSSDGGARWNPLAPPVSAFGFAVAAHPTDRQVAWFAPRPPTSAACPRTGRCVSTDARRRKSWETLRAGLPQHDAYDLIYRHGLEVDEAGARLIMGSTTGGLWASENGGDDWADLPMRLPPIYSVRFA